MKPRQKVHFERMKQALSYLDGDRALSDKEYLEVLEEVQVEVESRIEAKK